jgi:hypothetical protein
MGLMVLALFVFTVAQSLLPYAQRDRLAGYIHTKAVFFNTCYLVFVSSFLLFGLLRTMFHWRDLLSRFQL